MSGEKTEEPTAQRLRKARAEGDVPVSAALTQVAAMVAAVVSLPSAAALTIASFRGLLNRGLRGDIPDPFELLTTMLKLTVPVALAAAIAAAAVASLQTQGLFTPGKLTPKIQNLDPIEGFKKLLKPERLFQVLRAALLAFLVTGLSIHLVRSNLASLVHTVGQSTAVFGLSAALVWNLLWLNVGAATALAAVDALLTRRSWLKRNRMSKDEIKREHKDSEGDPQLKQERQRAHQEMLTNASILAIRDADVLIVNPTHLATALRYKDDNAAPQLVAQGEGLIAKQLVDAARAYGVPVVRDVPVARALRELSVGDEIPEALYEVVAEILREIWARSGGEADDAG